MRRWNIFPRGEAADMTLASQVLAARGRSPEDEEESISDPFLMADMEKAVTIIQAALYSGEKIMIFGDYDCDGVTSTVMLYQYLTAQGGEIDWLIPSRDEGYGLTNQAIDQIAEKGAKLIITVDNGISSYDEALYIKQKGIKLVITDHHEVPPQMPEADAVVNPKRHDDNSPFKCLAGCGVVLKLITALEGGDAEGVLERFADLAALGTIGDVVPLSGENKVIVKRGLEIMPYTENVGLYKLLRQSGFLNDNNDSSRLTANALSFTACPRINAAGRFAHAEKAALLLLSESEELAEIRANELGELNATRREVENEIVAKVEEYFTENPKSLSERILILRGDNWHNGVIGIVSSRLMNKWGKPNIVITDDGEFLRGSARSVEGFSLVSLLEHCKDKLEKFGGHVKAAGFTAKSENFSVLLEEIKSYCLENYPVMPVDVLNIDKVIEPVDLTLENVEGLKALAPFGEGNPVPLFMMQNCVILSKKPLKEGKFLSFNVRLGSIVQKVLNFGCAYSDFPFDIGRAVDILVTLDINEYNNTRSVQAQLKDIRPSGFNQERHFAALQAYESLVRGEEIDQRLAARALPEKEDLKLVYDIIRHYGGANADKIYFEASAKGMNYCKFRIITDVLNELNLIEYNPANGIIKLLPASAKADIESSETLNKMKSLAVK